MVYEIGKDELKKDIFQLQKYILANVFLQLKKFDGGNVGMARFLTIEAETSQLRVAEVESNGRKSRIRHCFWLPVPQGSVEDGQIRDTQKLGEFLRQQLFQRRIKTRKAYFVTGSTKIASREVTIPLVKKNRIQSIIEANATDYFPIDVSKYVLSYVILGIENQESGQKVTQENIKKNKNMDRQYRLMVYAAPKSVSASYLEFAESAKLSVKGITCIGDSVYQAVREEYASGTHILVKVEMNNTSISIIREGKLALQRNVNYGVDSAVEVIRSYPKFGENLEILDALAILRSRDCLYDSLDDHGSDGTDISEARAEVTESFRYMIGNVSRIMDYYLSRNTEVIFDSIVICGLGAHVKGVAELFTHELGQQVEVLIKAGRYELPSAEAEDGLAFYIAIIDPVKSGLNLMEKVSRKKKEEKETLSGAIVVLAVGIVAGVVLIAAGYANKLYQQRTQDHLNQRIAEESSIEDIYNAYNTAKAQYDNFESMYQYTNTPNEGLKNFIEELEKKMPSDITVDSFSSTGTQVNFSMRVGSKSAAANAIMQLRTFESLSTVTTTGIDEAEDGTVSMSVACTYENPAPVDGSVE